MSPGDACSRARGRVVSAALCYYARRRIPEPGEGRLPRYAWRNGYAELREKLDALGRRLGGDYRVLVDENQHVDREAAARSGVGFYGKNTLLITRRFGSWVVLGTLVTTAELEPTPPLGLDCGSCRLCIDACPTDALDEPGTLDATRCLSYWTQTANDVPEPYREALGAARLRLRHLPGRLPLEPRRREAARRRLRSPPAQRRTSRSSSGSSATPKSSRTTIGACSCRRKDGRYLKRNALVALGNAGRAEDRADRRALPDRRRPAAARVRGVGVRTARRARTRSTELSRRSLLETERWIAWVRRRSRSPSPSSRWSLFSDDYPSRRYEVAAWHDTALLGVGALRLPRGSAGGTSRRARSAASGFAALVFDSAIVAAYVLIYSFEAGTPIRQARRSFRSSRRRSATAIWGGVLSSLAFAPVHAAFEWLHAGARRPARSTSTT